MAKASGGDMKKNIILVGVTVLLLGAALVFGFRESLFPATVPREEATAASTANDEVVNRITGGQPATVEPDPPGPLPEPGSGRRAQPAR